MSAVLISLGSNLGGRAGYLRSALRKIAEFAAIERTSFLYETEPMHVLEQPRFLNAAAALRTTLTPHELLAALQSVERMLGRDHANGVRYGPRVIDLDIVRYGDWSDVVATDDLAIPHPRLAEREFVLRPLLDLVPDDIELRRMVGALEASSHPPRRVLALDRCGSRCDDSASDARETTLAWGAGGDGAAVMGIVNATPDSFSGDGIVGGDDDDDDDDDDGELETSYVQRAADQAERMVAAGAAMIDVGGQSTRPGALSVGAEAEAARVVPVIAELRRRELGVPVSVDTYFASVARAAVAAGANAVNDISAGALDPTMAATLGELGVPAMLMHTRGTPATMQSLAEYATGEVVATVATELSPRVTEFEKAGVPRWDIVIDPGVGFAKTTEHVRRGGEGGGGGRCVLLRCDRLRSHTTSHRMCPLSLTLSLFCCLPTPLPPVALCLFLLRFSNRTLKCCVGSASSARTLIIRRSSASHESDSSASCARGARRGRAMTRRRASGAPPQHAPSPLRRALISFGFMTLT